MIPLFVSRDLAQGISIFFMITGVFLLISTEYLHAGVCLVGIAVWVMTMSESILLAKVQNEMMVAMEDISQQKAREVEQVLYFLQQSSIAASPFESIDGAKRLCSRTLSPAMVLSADYQIIKANKSMHQVLEWKDCSLTAVPAYTINDPLVMSKIGEFAAQISNINQPTITSNYVYTASSGKKITGLMHAAKIGVEGYFVFFFPDDSFAFTKKEINNFMVKNV